MRKLLAQTQLSDQGTVTVDVLLLQVGQQITTAANHLEQAAAAVVVMLVYLFAGCGTLALRRKTGGAVWAQLLGIAFFGGFLFQLVWETKSRYCFPFFVFLLPLAAVGFITALRWAEDKSAK